MAILLNNGFIVYICSAEKGTNYKENLATHITAD